MRLSVRSRFATVVVAGALAATVGTTGVAFAEDAIDVSGYVSASNTPAAQAAPEYLGISGVDELQAFPTDIYTDLKGNAGLKYLLMGTTQYNINPNPYFYNYVYSTDGTKVVDNTDKRRKGYSPTAREIGMPIAALAPYGGNDATDTAVWNTLPDIIIGNFITKTDSIDYSGDEYARAVEKAKGLATNSYAPIASTYTMNSMSDVTSKLYELADNAEKVVENSKGTKTLRYGDAEPIAANFEKYVKGTQGYVLSQLEKNNAEKKTVAVVSAVNEDGTFTLTVTPSKFSTATRFLEITTNVANNWADSQAKGEDGKVTVTREQLAAGDIDLIILETGAAKADMGELTVKTYWADSNNTGAIYKVDANSVEIATNYGRMLGCLYPEYVSQSDWVAYYYDNFYHVKASKIADAVDLGMDGVRNWDVQSGTSAEMTNWTKETVADYSEVSVDQKLNEGMAWIEAQGEEAPELLKFDTDHSFESVAKATVEVSDVTYTGKAQTPEVSVKVGNAVLTEGTDYELVYANNTEVGTATVYVYGKGNYLGETSATFQITKVDKTALEQAILNANTTMDGVKVSVNGSDVATGEKWVTKLDKEKLEAAIAVATVVDKNDKATQTQVDAAIAELSKAVDAFKAAEKDGTKSEANKTALKEAISAANAEKGSVKVSADGKDVVTSEKWVTQSEMDVYSAAIAEAQKVADNADATQAEVDAATKVMTTATDAFKKAENAGTKAEADKAALKEVISAANALKDTVKVSENGSDVDPAQLWVTQSEMNVFTAAIAEAQKVADNAEATQAEVDAATKVMTAATDAFKKVEKQGTYTPAVTRTVTRAAGNEAENTAVDISSKSFESADMVIIANDRDFMDSMSATGLAGAYDAPILLVNPDTGLYGDVAEEITRLGAKSAYIIGGEHAVTTDVEGQLDALGVTHERIAGWEAPDTSVECAKAIEAKTGDIQYAVVARSDNFQDALSMSSFAYAYKVPIILAPSTEGSAATSLPEGGLNVLNAADTQVIIAGGKGAITDDVLNGVTAAHERIWGEDGYDTSNQIATYMTNEGLLNAKTTVVANGALQAKGLDALAGAALAGKSKGVMLLANGSEHTDVLGDKDFTTIDETADSQGTASYFTAHADSIENAYVLGGTYVAPEEFKTTLEDILGID